MKTQLTIYLFLFFLFRLQNSPAQTQQIKFNLVEGAGDVSLGKINAITQDPNGYMWFADMTKSCITRYDGYRMVSFRHDPGNPNSLAGTYPETIIADRDGNIWIGFYGMGLDRYDPKTETFTHFHHDKNNPFSLS